MFKIYDRSLKIHLKEMFTKIDFKILIVTLLGSAVWLFLFHKVMYRKMCTFELGDWIRICGLIYLGLFEEMTFRSWGYIGVLLSL